MHNQGDHSFSQNSEYLDFYQESHKDSSLQAKKQLFPLRLRDDFPQQFQEECQINVKKNKKSSQVFQDSIKVQQPKSRRSVFHNFQKHLVITLRKAVKIKISISKKQKLSAAWQIWQNFMKKSRIYTKNILHIVFGVCDYEDIAFEHIYDAKTLQRFGYTQIFSKYSDSLLMQAQQYLRSQVACQLKYQNLKELMKGRRIQKSPQFIDYVEQFISQLEEGPMRKRLPKSRKILMKSSRDIHK